MSVSEPIVPQYPSPSHTEYIDTAPLNGETSSTTSSETESQFITVKGAQQNGPVVVENGPDMYHSDSSIDSGQGQVGQYINGPMPAVTYQGGEYDPQMEGQIAYPVPTPEYDGNTGMEYPSPTQEYISQEQLYPSQGTEYVDYPNQTPPQPVAIGPGGEEVVNQVQNHGQPGSPPQQGPPSQGEKQKYVFYLHIKQGEAFPVENGDQVRYIHGPTMVQLVSSSPNPPSIHMVQTGLGPVNTVNTGSIHIHAGPLPPTTMPLQPPVQEPDGGVPPTVFHTGQGTVPQHMYPPIFHHQPIGHGGGGVYPQLVGYPNPGIPPPHMHPPPPPQGSQLPGHGGGGVPPPHHPPHVHVQRYPSGGGPAPHAPSHHVSNIDHTNRHDQSHRPVLSRSRSKDERADKQREKLQRKLHERRKENGGGYSSSPQTSPRGHSSSSSRGSSTSPRENRSTSYGHRSTENGNGGRSGTRKKRTSSSSPRNGEEEDHQRLHDLLSTMQQPEVFEITSRTASIRWPSPALPASKGGEPISVEDYNLTDITYEVLLADKGKGGNSRTLHSEKKGVHLDDLRPYTEYQISVRAISDSARGDPSPHADFKTLGSPPDRPMPPKMSSKTKSSLMLKWLAPNSNGSRIHSYILQCEKGNGYNDSRTGFVTVYEGSEKQHKVTKLQPSTCYRFRLQAVNTSHGASDFSDEVKFFTSGSVPPPQDCPTLVEAQARSLTLQWQHSTGDVTGYILEMEDDSKKYGFQPAYRGDETTYTCRTLARNTEYRFRLCAFNEEGNGRWSSVVAFQTTPDSPRAPSKPCLKGKVHSNSFKVSWEPPRDTGGSEVESYTAELSEGSDSFSEVYLGIEKECQITDLRPGTLYKVRVSCKSRGGTSPFSEFCGVSTLPVCPGLCPPPRLHGKPKATSLNLRWGLPEYDGGAQVTEFSIEMTAADEKDKPAKEIHKGPSDTTECCVNHLLPGRVYSFRLRAFNRIGPGHFSEPLQVTTGAGPPEAPDGLVANFKSPTSACVSWEKPCCNGADITEYKLEKASENGSFGLAYTGPSTSCELRSLRPATYYYLRVQAINAAGPGPFSDVATCTTPSSSPEVVPSLRVISSTSDSLLLKWTEPNNCGEEIVAYNIDIGKDQPIVVEGNITEYCLDQLEPDTKHRIRIQAVNSKGAGPYSATLKAITQALPPPPPRLECTLKGHQSLKLRWGEVPKIIFMDNKNLSYTLEMEDKRGKFIVVYSGINTSHKVTRLTENTMYKFRICASNDAGHGQFSEEYSFCTLKAPPPAMKPPKIVEKMETSCSVSWTKLPPMQDDQLLYQCQCLRSRDDDKREDDLKMIYRGEESSACAENLESNCEYRFRVCAIRVSTEEGNELVGVYSPWGEPMQMSSLQNLPHLVTSSDGKRTVSGKNEQKPWEDQHVAAVIMAILFISAIVIAFVLQWWVS